jgi:hypothetical protein
MWRFIRDVDTATAPQVSNTTLPPACQEEANMTIEPTTPQEEGCGMCVRQLASGIGAELAQTRVGALCANYQNRLVINNWRN